MKLKSILWVAVLFTMIILTACQPETQNTGKALEPEQPRQIASPSPSQISKPSPLLNLPVQDPEHIQPINAGYPSEDTIDWESVPEDFRPLPYIEGTRHLPGERLGLTGPIIAEGGKGGSAYIAVFDAAGVLVGGVLKSEANENPEKLRIILEMALKRSEHQNHFTLTKMRQNGALDR